MTDESPTTDALKRRRRLLILIISVVALIGLTGGTIAALVGDDTPTTSAPTASSTATTDPFTVEGLCRSDEVARYPVTADPQAGPEFTATGAVQAWVGPAEASRTTSTSTTSKLVSIGVPGELPRVVITVEQTDAEWQIVETAACLSSTEETTACASEAFELGKARYRYEANSTRTDLGRFLGNGTINRPCPREIAGTSFRPRGAIGPVSAFAALRTRGSLVIEDDLGQRAYTRR